ncbi:hypothetical protein JCM5296_001964 [Sporobolomyces johnsonii]
METPPKPHGPSTTSRDPPAAAPHSAAPLASSSPLASIDSSAPAPAPPAPEVNPAEGSVELSTVREGADRAAWCDSIETEPSGDSEARQFTAEEKGKGKAVQQGAGIGQPAPAPPSTGSTSATEPSSPPAPQHRAEPQEEEWLLKSIAWPPLPPPPSDSHPDSNTAAQPQEGFDTDERLRVKIIQQNRNGPCSLIALCNILILRNSIHIAPGRDSVTYSFLSNLLADYFLRITTTTPSSEVPLTPTSATTTQLSLEAALSILPSTQSGLNLNPQFSRIDGFVSTPSSGAGELALFSLAQIPLLHGWLADPGDQETYEALREAGNYDRALEMVVEGSEIAGGRLELREEEMSDEELISEAQRRSQWTPLEEQKVRRAHLINTFLNSTSTQLTYPGLFALSSTPSLLPPSGLAALFRNSHLSVLYRRPSSPSSTPSTAASHGGPELFTLVTDSSFAGEEEVVWESLEDTDGSGSEFYTAGLRRSRTRGGDWAGVRAEEEQQAGRGRASAREEEADLALAHRLQAEENDRAAYEYERERARRRQAQAQQELDDLGSDDTASLDDAPRGARAPPPTPYTSTTTTTTKAEAGKEGQGGKAASGTAAAGARRTSKGGKSKAEKDKCAVM